MTTKIFFDTEFTGLHQYTSLISIGMVSETGLQFYAEFTDYAQDQCDDWIQNNVIRNTQWLNKHAMTPLTEQQGELTRCVGPTEYVVKELTKWLTQFELIEMWADCLAYDWVLFCQLFGGACYLPNNIFYMPSDLVALFVHKGLNPDTDRQVFIQQSELALHNALNDALMTQSCYLKLTNM